MPQVVCYETPVPHLIRFGFKHIIKVKFISLVNLIANKEIVPEMLADRFSVDGIANELYQILPGEPGRDKMLAEYQKVRTQLGDKVAPDEAAGIMFDLLVKRREMLLRMARERAEAEAKAAAEAAERARQKAIAEAEAAKKRAEEQKKPDWRLRLKHVRLSSVQPRHSMRRRKPRRVNALKKNRKKVKCFNKKQSLSVLWRISIRCRTAD